jgi:hypothetical protein
VRGPQRHLERCLKSFRGSGRNSVPGGSWEHVSDEFDRLIDHIGKACRKEAAGAVAKGVRIDLS